MENIKSAQGRKLPVMVVALALALTVNGAFALVLTGASTNGQRIYEAWYKSGGETMVAMVSAEQHKLREDLKQHCFIPLDRYCRRCSASSTPVKS